MEKRKLSETEIKVSENSIRELGKRLDYLDFIKDYQKLMVEKGLLQNYLDKKSTMMKENRAVINEIEEIKNIIKITQDQIKNGVEVKEEKKEAK